jgi:hypothetical protein
MTASPAGLLYDDNHLYIGMQCKVRGSRLEPHLMNRSQFYFRIDFVENSPLDEIETPTRLAGYRSARLGPPAGCIAASLFSYAHIARGRMCNYCDPLAAEPTGYNIVLK